MILLTCSFVPTGTEIRSRQTKVEHELVPKTNFANLKSQCAYKIAELINEHNIRFDVIDYRDLIIEELSAVLKVKDVDSDGKLQIKSKEDVKLEIGKSPDIGDTIVYRAWFELRKEAIDDNPDKEKIIVLQQNKFSRNKFNMKQNSTR
jgi:hypothetical protein